MILLCLHVEDYFKAGLLLFIKLLINKYPAVRDIVEESGEGDFQDPNQFTNLDP